MACATRGPRVTGCSTRARSNPSAVIPLTVLSRRGRSAGSVLVPPSRVHEVSSLVASLQHDMVCVDDDIRSDVLEEGHLFTPIAEALRRSLRDSGVPGS
jgi:hypothetical protein